MNIILDFITNHAQYYLGFIFAGLVVGAAVGATGVGGGSLMTPILIMLFNVHPAKAVGTDLLYAALTKSFGVWLHRTKETINKTVLLWLALGSLPASALTLIFLHFTNNNAFKSKTMVVTLAIMIIATGLFTLYQTILKPRERIIHHTPESKWMIRSRPFLTIFLGAVVGTTVTLSSVGAGAIAASLLLVMYSRLPTVMIVATDIAYAIPLTLLAGFGHIILNLIDANAFAGNWKMPSLLAQSGVDFAMLGAMLCGSLPGIYIGTKFGFKVPDKILRMVLAGMLILIGITLLNK